MLLEPSPRLKAVWRAVLGIGFVAALGPTVAAAAPSRQPPEPVRLDTRAVEEFMGAFLSDVVAPSGVPGAAWTVVQTDRVVAKGAWGVADVSRTEPVNPDETVFCVGSNGKLLTATAAMQLVEEKRIALDADVNSYLPDFRLEPAFGKPVTLAHLLTHTAGFDDRIIGTVTHDPQTVRSLGPYLATSMPPRIAPPGITTRYSNHGLSLVGFVVETAAGEPFETYVRRSILEPLGMTRSAFQEPPPPEVAGRLARAYLLAPGSDPAPAPRPYVNVVPAGALYATASDMGRFVRAHLGGGEVDGARILSPETLSLMHARQFASDPDLPGMAYGFMEFQHGASRGLWHTGTCPMQHHSLLALLPEEGTGIFFAINAVDRSVSHELLVRFFDRFFPPGSDAPGVATPAPPTLSPAGTYRRTIQGSWRTVEKIAYAGQDLVVRDIGDGRFEMPLEGRPVQWVPEGPTDSRERQLFRHVDGSEKVAVHGDNGRVTALYTEWAPIAHYEPIALHETAAFQVPLLAGAVLVFLSPGVVWPIRALVRHRRRHSGTSRRLDRWFRWTWVATAGTGVAFLLLFLFVLAPRLANEPGPAFAVVMRLPTLFAVGSLALALLAVAAWPDRETPRQGRLATGLVAASALAISWLLLYWNLIPGTP